MTRGNKRELKPCKTINLIQGKVEIWRGTISLKDAKPYSTSEGRYRYIEEVPPAPACHKVLCPIVTSDIGERQIMPLFGFLILLRFIEKSRDLAIAIFVIFY